jgi:hypothetical protein
MLRQRGGIGNLLLHAAKIICGRMNKNLLVIYFFRLKRKSAARRAASGEHLAELKAIYERDHPEAKASAGAALAQKRWDATDNLAIASFAKTAATDTGIDERSVRRARRLG